MDICLLMPWVSNVGGSHTLSIQFACRIDGGVAVQVYRSPAVPDMPPMDLRDHLPRQLRRLTGAVLLRQT
jgi:hypothetical protein